MSLSFNISTISILKEYFTRNTVPGRWRKDSVSTLNYALKILFSRVNKLSSRIDKTMDILDTEGCIKDKVIIPFVNTEGQNINGEERPSSLKSGIWRTLRKLSGNEKGQFIFTLSLLEGLHCVTLLMNKNEKNTSVYWCDRSNGCVKMSRKNLDSFTVQVTLSSWDEHFKKTGKKLKTDATVWLLKPVKNSSGLVIH